MKTLISYARWSTASQSDGTSEARQIEAAKSFAKANGFTLSPLSYFDRGRSGFKGNKQAVLGEFLKAIDRGEVKKGDTLLVEDISRLSRKGVRETQNILNRIWVRASTLRLFSRSKRFIGQTTRTTWQALSNWLRSPSQPMPLSVKSGWQKSYWTKQRKDAESGRKGDQFGPASDLADTRLSKRRTAQRKAYEEIPAARKPSNTFSPAQSREQAARRSQGIEQEVQAVRQSQTLESIVCPPSADRQGSAGRNAALRTRRELQASANGRGDQVLSPNHRQRDVRESELCGAHGVLSVVPLATG